ncbi:MAG: hypothetical protein H6838_04895 [Planctomycetes bacterium]|nr:hypothetical protein [Planctomycetota bacterium]
MNVRPLLLPLLAAAACSTVPEASYPPFADHDLRAEFVVPASGEFLFPASDARRVVQQLQLLPPPRGERFGAAGERWLLYPAGTKVQVTARLRTFAGDDGTLPTPAELLPGATILSAQQP